MSRAYSGVERRGVSSPWSAALPASDSDAKSFYKVRLRKIPLESWALRGFLVVCAGAICYVLGPFHLHGAMAAGIGVLTAGVILLAEMRLRWAALSRLLGGAFGAVVGIFAAVLVTLVISRTAEPEPTKSFLECAVLVAFAYLGLVLGSKRAGDLRLEAIGERVVAGSAAAGNVAAAPEMLKLLDTSVLIDGRIADICEAQFLDGVLLVPQFVLHELQLVADSGDALKRQRGRRGLDVLERIRKIPGVQVRIVDHESQRAGDVDHKLVEVAQKMGAKIITNDFNLNKVATLQGLAVLNVNQLASALKPVVLSGETMRVLILREGKEANQGVAYLDDGTMVVVDGARRFINKSVDITVTSVHQTTAGKMIFGRVDERAESSGAIARQAAAGAGRTEVGGRVSNSGGVEPGNRPTHPAGDAD
jgi:uncharacterized protein YacL